MANELKPIEIAYTNYRGETSLRNITPQRVWFGSTEWHPEPQWLVTAYDHDKKANRDFALKDFNTRPAAPVEGLETTSFRTLGEDYVTRSQAEAIIAAERAEKERLAALLHKNGTPRFNAVCERAEKAEADNAALTARVKELQAELQECEAENNAKDTELETLKYQLRQVRLAQEREERDAKP